MTTGLDKIIAAINSDAQAAAADVLSEAKKQAEEILSAAEIEADRQREISAQKSAADVKAHLERAYSAAQLKNKQRILQTKQELISAAIGDARQKLYSLSDDEYFEIIVKMLARHVQKQAGIVYFSEKDLKRAPKNLQQRIDSAAKIKGGTLKLSDRPRKMQSGFVIAYGSIEENCSFEALFEAEKETLQDIVHEILFD